MHGTDANTGNLKKGCQGSWGNNWQRRSTFKLKIVIGWVRSTDRLPKANTSRIFQNALTLSFRGAEVPSEKIFD